MAAAANCNFANSSANSSAVGCIVGLDVSAAPAVPAGNTGVCAGCGVVTNPGMFGFGGNKAAIAPTTAPPMF